MTEFSSILESLETYCRVEGHVTVSEALADIRLLFAAEVAARGGEESQPTRIDDQPGS
ncbi:MAG: hypothetical protein AAF245_08625 [Pseudomonadota bacterium]